MTQAIPPSAALPASLPVALVPTTDAPPAGNGPSFASTAAAAGAGNSSSASTGTTTATGSTAGSGSNTPPAADAATTRAAAPAQAAAAMNAVASTQAATSTAPVAQIVAAAQAALSSSVNLSPQAQQAVKLEAFNQLVANLVNHIQSGSAAVPANWPAAGVSPQLQAFLSNLMQQATASQPVPQQLVSAQAWPTALTNAVLQLAGQAAAAGDLPPALVANTPQAAMAAAADKAQVQLPTLQNWLVQQGTVQAADGERGFTLTLRVPVAWAQAQAALGSALSGAAGAGPAQGSPIGFAATPLPFATGFASGSLGGMLQLPFAGSVQQLQNSSMGLVMQPQVLPGSPAAAAAQAMRTSAILALEFQPLAQAAQSAQLASVYLPGHMLPQDVQAMLQNKATDPWVLMMQNEADGNGKKQPRNANEHNQNFCNRAGCQYQGRAVCSQPFCAEMNYLWSVDRAHRASKL